MKNLSTKIVKDLLTEGRYPQIKTTITDYVRWYFGIKKADDFDFDKNYDITEFDPDVEEKHFNNDRKATFDFIKNEMKKGTNIVVKQQETEYGDVEASFKLGKYEFNVVSMDVFKK